MKELIQQKFWVHTRGTELLLPPQTVPLLSSQEDSSRAALEEERLYQIVNDGTLKRRYPEPHYGKSFMGEVCYDRRNTLLGLAQEASDEIADQWQEINHEKPIAVVLFGSVAKGLVKAENHSDPSNIDLAVVGQITPEEREELFDAIRPYRETVKERITATCAEIDSEEDNPGNLGVLIQHTDRLTNGHFSGMTSYLGSSAFPLYDPHNIWQELEEEALRKLHDQREKKRKSPYVRSSLWKNAERKARRATEKIQKKRSQLPQSGEIYTQTSFMRSEK